MTKQLARVLCIAALVVLATTSTQAQLTPSPLYDFRASNNPGHPDAFVNLGEIGGELGVQGLTPELGFDTFAFYNVDAGDGSFDILEGGDGVIIESGFTYEMLMRRTGDGYGSEDQIAAIAEGGGKKIFLSRASQGVSMLLFSDNGGGDVRQIGHSDIMNLPAGEWTHFMISFDDETDVGKVYVNGGAPSTLDFTGIELTEDPADLVTLFKTRGSESGNRRLQGDISEARLYDFVLTDEQAMANYRATVPEDTVFPPTSIGGRDEVGNQPIAGSFANQVFTEPEGSAPGLAQSWYGSSGPTGRNRDLSKDGIERVAQFNDRAIPLFHGEDGTWWTGSNFVTDVQQYPSPDLDGAIETEGGNEGFDFYNVKLEGEILIPESGTIRFVDGVDDYAYLAIDTDRSGTAGDSESEVLINDDDWTDALAQQPPADDGDPPPPIVEVNFEGIAEGGEWLAIEFNVIERDGGDAGMLYWDAMDEDGAFPTVTGGDGGVLDEDAAALQIPDTHLRGPTTAATHVSSDVNGVVPERSLGWEVDVNPADGTSDTFAIEDLSEGREEITSESLTTILDVDGVELHINPLGEVAAGDSFQVFVSDQVTGTPIIATEGWIFNPATGEVCFNTCGGLPSVIGDSNLDGVFDSGDLVTIFAAGKYDTGEPAGWEEGDWNQDMVFDSGDLVFAFSEGNYQAAARPAAVPEPSSLVLALLSVVGFVGVARRRLA